MNCCDRIHKVTCDILFVGKNTWTGQIDVRFFKYYKTDEKFTEVFTQKKLVLSLIHFDFSNKSLGQKMSGSF